MALTTRITSKGQITLPKEVRKLLKVDTGSVILFEKKDEKVFIRPTKTLLDYKGYLKGRKGKMDFEMIRERAKEYLAEKASRGKRGK